MNRKSIFFRILIVVGFIFPQTLAQTLRADSPKFEKPSFLSESAFPELPTYYQLMQLDEKTRTEYINGVISLVDYLERRKQGFDSRPPEAFFPVHIKSFLEIFLKSSSSPATASLNCVKSCPAGYDMVNSAESNYCLLSKCPEGTKDSGTYCRMGGGCAYSCDRMCTATYSGGSSAAQQQALQDALKKKADEMRKQLEAPSNTDGSGGTSKLPEGAVNVPNITKDPNGTMTLLNKDTAPDAKASPRSGGRFDDSQFDPNNYNGKMTPEQQEALKKGLEAEGQKRLKEKEEAKKCEAITCPEQDGQYRFQVKKDFNARVTETKNASCINGGLISQYDIAGRQKCKPVQKLKLGTMSLKCKAGQTMCSPLLFGLQQDTPATPFCVQIGIEITKSCYDMSKGAEGAKKFWKNKDVTHEILSDEWNKLRDALKDLCVETRSAQYHCVECAVIAKRLKELNKIADKCPEQNSCGQKIECSAWKRIKGLDEDTTGAAAAAGGASGGTGAPAAGAAKKGTK